MKKIIAALAGTLLLAALLTLMGKAWGDEPTDEELWDEYEVLAEEAGAGESVPTPDDPEWGKPWLAGCKDDWCPSILEGVNAGENWCKSNKCRKNHTTGAAKIHAEYKAWLDDCGGQPGLWPAQTARTESFGAVFSMTKSGTKECGLCSVDRNHAKALDINACDPEANVWASCWFRNKRLLNLREKFPAIADAPLEDQWMLAGAAGAVGGGKVYQFIHDSGALKSPHPYKRFRAYVRSLHPKWKKSSGVHFTIKKIGKGLALAHHGLTVKQWKYLRRFKDLYAKHGDWFKLFGCRPGRTVFRLTRPHGAARVISGLYDDGKIPWGEPVLPPRPAGIYPYPDKDKHHCACGHWPELEGKRPEG